MHVAAIRASSCLRVMRSGRWSFIPKWGAGRFRSQAILSLLLFLLLLPVGPAFAQVDWSGLWNPVGSRQITDNPDLGDYAGFPLSDAGRRRAQTWAANMMEVAQNVCRPYPLEMAFAPSNMRVWTEVD